MAGDSDSDHQIRLFYQQVEDSVGILNDNIK